MSIYTELAEIAVAATRKLAGLFGEFASAAPARPLSEMLLRFLVSADCFTETCCQEFAKTLRRESTLAEIRGTPTATLARQIREDCFARTDAILATYIQALRACDVQLKLVADELQHNSVLRAALVGAGQGQLAAGLGRFGSPLGVFSAVLAGFSETERKFDLMWEQRKMRAEAERVAAHKMADYLRAIPDITEGLLDFGCAKVLGGEVDFANQSRALSDIQGAVSDEVAAAIGTVAIMSAAEEANQDEPVVRAGPDSGLPPLAVSHVRELLGSEGESAVIYEFKCQVGMKVEGYRIVAITPSRVWFGAIVKKGSEISGVVQVRVVPLTELRAIVYQNKNSMFSGPIARITFKWGGVFEMAILESRADRGSYFAGVLRRFVTTVNRACVVDMTVPEL